ncbi:MAG TPA: hypothetical protein VH933_13120 [Aestuariivirgaceae bacterium]
MRGIRQDGRYRIEGSPGQARGLTIVAGVMAGLDPAISLRTPWQITGSSPVMT